MVMFRFSFAAVCAAALVGLSAHGAFIDPTWNRPADAAQASADLTTYQEWNVFTSPDAANGPDVADVNPHGSAAAWDTSGGSFVTSGGNIYSPSAILAMQTTLPGYDLGPASQTHFLVQLRTLGSELDVTSLMLDGIAVSTLDGYAYTELARIALGGFGGAQVDHAFSFIATNSAASHTLTWLGAESSVSQDIIVIDTLTTGVPEPASAVLLAAGASALLWRRVRHGQA